MPTITNSLHIAYLYGHVLMSSLAVYRTAISRGSAFRGVLASREFQLAVVIPALLLACGTMLFRFTNFDMAIAELFYDDIRQTWPLLRVEPWNTFYVYGPLPGLVIGICGGIVGIIAAVLGKWNTWGKAGVFLGLMLTLGPGLAVNTVFKPNWGRPRPSQIERFGGDHAFLQVGNPGWNSRLRSFPSGHASMGFYLIAPAFLCFRRRPGWALAFLMLGLCAGGVLGATRIVQGRHFASDILWSAGMVYFSGLMAYFLLGIWRWSDDWRTAPTPDPAMADLPPEIYSIELARRERERAREEPAEPERRKTA